MSIWKQGELRRRSLKDVYGDEESPLQKQRKKRLKRLKRYEPLCRKLIQTNLACGYDYITSWLDFGNIRARCNLDSNVSRHVLLKAMAYGKQRGWLKAKWAGVGLTPWSMSARRQRMYNITDLAKREVKVQGEG